MCGICGLFSTHPDEAEPASPAVAAMVSRLRHRGPDDFGQHLARGRASFAALGHTRLAVIGVADGQQPLRNEDGSLVLVVNGEVYNHRALRAGLIARGHRFATGSDCEVLLHLYEERGLALLEGVVGMFAFALYDARRDGLLLGRDRLGKKPLYYTGGPDGLAFASELPALLDAAPPMRAADVDPVALRAALSLRYVPPPRTIHREVRQLPPAHLAWVDARALSVSRYWELAAQDPPPSRYEARRAVRLGLDRAVRERMESEVPLGAFLSGGIDSTLVVSAMARASSVPVSTFAIGFADAPDHDERPHAAFVARSLGCAHHEEVIQPDAAAVLPQLIEHLGEPFADSSVLPSWYLAQLARRHVTVALSGDGGDELFAGYRRYLAGRLGALLDRMPGVARALSAALLAVPVRREGRSRLSQLRRFADRLTLPPLERYAAWLAAFDRAELGAVLRPEWAPPLEEPADWLGAAIARDPQALARDPVAALCRIDLDTYLPGDLLVKVDRSSMAHALEVRCPFLDHRLVELANRLPGAWRLPRTQLKGLLKRALAADLPRRIARRPKQGFAVPLAAWLRGPLAGWLDELLLDPSAGLLAFCRPEALKWLVAEHRRGVDHGERLWSLAVLSLWCRRFLR